MSLTGRPSSPPLALTSSSQIFWARRADLPLAARPPVIAMLKPILIGVPDCAAAPPVSAAAMTAATAAAASAELSLKRMSFLPYEFFAAAPRAEVPYYGHFKAVHQRCGLKANRRARSSSSPAGVGR